MAGPIYTGSESGSGSGGGSAPTSTWVNRPAVGPVGSRIYISDIGEYGAEFVSNGTVWAHTGEIELVQKAKGWIVPSLAAADAATYSQSGTTITVTSTGHNIPATGYNTKDVYLNIGTAATGATIPPGWFSNFTYVSADSFTCVSTVSQTGTGAVNTNLAQTFIPDLITLVQGGLLGLNGKISFNFIRSNGGAGIKNVIFSYNSIDYLYNNLSPTRSNSIYNRNSATSQVISHEDVIYLMTVNTALDFNCGFSTSLDTASSFIAIHAASVYISIS